MCADRRGQWEHRDCGAAAATGRGTHRRCAALRHPRRSLQDRRVAHWPPEHQSRDAWRGLGRTEARRVGGREWRLLAGRVAGDAGRALQPVRDTAAAAVSRCAHCATTRAHVLLRALPSWELRGLATSLAATHSHVPSPVQPGVDLTDQCWPSTDRVQAVLGTRQTRNARKRV